MLIFSACISAMMVVVKTDGAPFLCKTDEVGELCITSKYCGTGYWGLQGITNNMFKVGPLVNHFSPITNHFEATYNHFLITKQHIQSRSTSDHSATAFLCKKLY